MNHKTKTALRFGVSALIVLLGGCSGNEGQVAREKKVCAKNDGFYSFIVVVSGVGNTKLFLCRDGSVRWK